MTNPKRVKLKMLYRYDNFQGNLNAEFYILKKLGYVLHYAFTYNNKTNNFQNVDVGW